jgi:hypothetical protein
MPIQTLPQIKSTGAQAGENFSSGIANALGMLTKHKMDQLHQRSQWQQKQKELDYAANKAQQQKQFAHNLEQQKREVIFNSLKEKVGEPMARILSQNDKALAAFAEQQNYGIEGLDTLQGMNPANQQQDQGYQALEQPNPEQSFGPMEQGDVFGQALRGNAPNVLNPRLVNEAVSDVNKQRRAAHEAAKGQKPKGPTSESNHSAWVLSTIKNPRGKQQEKMVDRAEKEQDRLEKQYAKPIEKYAKASQQAQAAQDVYQKQVDLINSGNMPNPTNAALRDTLKHGGLRTAGTAIGAAVGGPVGALLGGGLTGGIDLSSFAGTEGNELLSLNTQLYQGAGEIFPRLTETEFGKYELGLPQLTDTDEVKIKKINSLLFKDQRDYIINQKIEEIKDENGGYLKRNIISEAEKRAKKDLAKLSKQYHSGKFGYKYEPKDKQEQKTGFGKSWFV